MIPSYLPWVVFAIVGSSTGMYTVRRCRAPWPSASASPTLFHYNQIVHIGPVIGHCRWSPGHYLGVVGTSSGIAHSAVRIEPLGSEFRAVQACCNTSAVGITTLL